ncbi:DUF3800 domain-containing protein [Paracoccus siganidrum]|uniref:DUF3800 domain-containing protein n=1 Tax=Paracoccus siganidrum TaxID=1276757 RepID=A0A419A429_9RHOB|nr:DUF3800 domain-containing protein [Paracoccus siganidrum]RJL08398.1 DUF3800 domain-containing protein [Paracoccus siganidrum]RMC39310.1 DUF3800 domain-containing protein [Paracoccus siganidrum]
MSELDYDYVLYIDEAGDDGLKRVMPIDPNGSSEWLVISGLLVRSEDVAKCRTWLEEIRSDIKALQSGTLHFRKLSDQKRVRAASMLSQLPVRAFTVCSNKKNMRGYKNERAAVAGGKQWFYNWVVRILMERATNYCLDNSRRKLHRDGIMKVIFSARGGHSYGHTKAYWTWLRAQGKPLLSLHEMRFEVLRFRLVEYVPHYAEAGLQLADIVASAFYQAVESGSKRWSVESASALDPIMARGPNGIVDVGLVLQPHKIDTIGLTEQQRIIFEHYGYYFRP